MLLDIEGIAEVPQLHFLTARYLALPDCSASRCRFETKEAMLHCIMARTCDNSARILASMESANGHLVTLNYLSPLLMFLCDYPEYAAQAAAMVHGLCGPDYVVLVGTDIVRADRARLMLSYLFPWVETMVCAPELVVPTMEGILGVRTAEVEGNRRRLYEGAGSSGIAARSNACCSYGARSEVR